MWDSLNETRADGLWEAANACKVGEGTVELQSKPAAWSSTTKRFELDLLEVCNVFVRRIRQEGRKCCTFRITLKGKEIPISLNLLKSRSILRA